MGEAISQAIVVSKDVLSEDVGTQRLALFNEDGTPLTLGGGATQIDYSEITISRVL